MKPFVRVEPTTESKQRTADDLVRHYQKDKCKALLSREVSEQELGRMMVEMATDAPLFRNDQYQVAVYDDPGPIVHLSVKRLDKRPIHDWRDLQEIKNMLIGPENEAVEIYPAESRRVDGANQFHIWCFKDPDFRIPVGFDVGRVVTETPLANSVNRPLEQPDAKV